MTDLSTPSRRQVLCGLVAGVLAPGALVACAGTLPVGGAGSAKPGTVLAAVSDIPIGGGTLVNVAGNGLLLVVRPTAAEVKAYNPTCPHQGATVQPPDGGIITCPAHGSQFDPGTGAVERGPAATGLTSVPVTVRGTDIVLA